MAVRGGNRESRRVFRRFRRRAGLLGLVGILSVTVMVFSQGCRHKPPDLTGCTRVEVHYTRYTQGAISHFLEWTPMLQTLLSEEEQKYVRSFDKWTVTDAEQIRAFSDELSRGRHGGRAFGKILAVPVDVRCYRGRNRMASFSIYPSIPPRVIANGHEFAYQRALTILRILDPPAFEPLTARWECAMKLSGLFFRGLWQGRERPPCPDPNQWCDVIVHNMLRMHIIGYRLDGKRTREYPHRVIARRFTCPAVHAPTDANSAHSPPAETDSLSQPVDNWLSDYAMNSNCREGSPDDMVLFFESQPGWNHHGGPEMFTFENHDPKGGCVLLNNGTAKFIRTEEELHQLRWE